MGSAPHLSVGSSGQISGVAMISELASRDHFVLNVEKHPNEIVWLGLSPLLRLATVELSLPRNGCSLIAMMSDPLVRERIFCLHDGGVDSIVLHFLPFTSQTSGKEKTLKTPSVFSVLGTCPGESSSAEPLHGFLTLSDSSGGSWIVGLTSSHECTVLHIETWNVLLAHAMYNEKDNAPVREAKVADSPTIISKELLTGPKAVLLPSSSPSLLSVTADSTEGRSMLHHYFKLFHENYVEYAHKVYFELQHHAPHLKKIIDDQHSCLRQVQQKLLDVEKKQENTEDRMSRAVQLHSSLETRLQNLSSLPGLHKKSLSKAERDFKSELDQFNGMELDVFRSSIDALNARLARHMHSPLPNSNKQRIQAAERRGIQIQENYLSQIKSSLEKLSLINSENCKKVKLVDTALISREISD